MSLRASLDKILIALLMASVLVLLSCASNPDGPGVVNHAPVIESITLVGGNLVIAAGMSVNMTVNVHDIDGDDLEYTWSSDDGSITGSGESVSWAISDGYGTKTITCTVSDGIDSSIDSRSFSSIGRRIHPGDFGESQGGEILWESGSSDEMPDFFILQRSVEIQDATLVVSAGTRIYCDQNSGLTLKAGARFEGIDFNGQSVLFLPWATNVSSWTYWKGITINAPEEDIIATGLHIKNAEHGLSMTLGTSQTLEVRKSKFEQCKRGIEAASIPVFGEELSFWQCERGMHLTSLEELILTQSSFFECDNYGLYLGETSGICTRTQFSGDNKTVFLGSNCRMSMSGNAFSVPAPNPFLTIGGGWDAEADSLDFRCNWWGDGFDSNADILPRIERDLDSPGLLLTPVAGHAPSSGGWAQCGGVEEPIALSIDLREEGHPLEDDPDWDNYDFTLPHAGPPAMQLVFSVDNPDQLTLAYEWSSPDLVDLFPHGGMVEEVLYPSQQDDLSESVIYAVTNETDSFTVEVTVEYVSDGEVQSLVHEETLFIP